MKPRHKEIKLAMILWKSVQKEHRLTILRATLEHVERQAASLDLHVMAPSLFQQ